MAQVDFYQLTRDPADRILSMLAQKICGDGGRLLVVSSSQSQLSDISDALWGAKPDSFLAHGHDGEGAAIQPILLSHVPVATNNARFIALADGAWRDEALGFDRVFYLFPPERTDDARAAWRKLGDDANAVRNYWRQDGGKWIKGP